MLRLSAEALDGGLPGALSSSMNGEGYCLVCLEPALLTEAETTVLRLGAALGLGPPLSLPGYGQMAAAVQHISVEGSYVHQGFSSNQAQGLHPDGTLLPVDAERVTLLLCMESAEKGGESLVFRADAAYRLLQSRDGGLAAALSHPGALTRRSEISGESHTGPVFVERGGRVFARYAEDNTSEWNVREVPFLREAREALRSLCSAHGTVIRTLLSPGDALILDNTRVSHGRESFVNSIDRRRRMIRAVFTGSCRLRHVA